MSDYPGADLLDNIDPANFVYFIRRGIHVKIGYSYDPEHRAAQIDRNIDGTAKPWGYNYRAPIEILRIFKGSRTDESLLHRTLNDFCAGGEWFIAEDELLAYIANVKPGTYPPVTRRGGTYVAPQPGLSEYEMQALSPFRSRDEWDEGLSRVTPIYPGSGHRVQPRARSA
jgi:hypothetical protein